MPVERDRDVVDDQRPIVSAPLGLFVVELSDRDCHGDEMHDILSLGYYGRSFNITDGGP